ncbi:putative alpha-ketoglutarate-dependent hypophosphite dioxygenase [Porphyridium purpureum]|uniref:Putative alpha-ketoglutarate-dependent hypophosphite dioxygenase n=1 Tax=Porphyridium purpureum TaxID=35688 RepID=A0A5J4YTW8_PORPP|nr:putative alpha-ketoglutarate-dependent hypophosphite dioxygenase [Porphyridium purpureum]|eukprot:POR2698..scf227_4
MAAREALREQFVRDGFVVLDSQQFLNRERVDALKLHLAHVLDGRYDRGCAPDKAPPVELDSRSSQQRQRKCSTKVIQVVNVHKCDSEFRALATSEWLGEIVAHLAGWDNPVHGGARLAQDQVWMKPAGAPPLAFHRDSPYFMFDPSDVATVWVALDDMDEEVGPLEYVRGSHVWQSAVSDARQGAAKQFFNSDRGWEILVRAARHAGIAEEHIKLASLAGMTAGGIAVHDGRTWHGSGKNQSSTKPRRGLGMHFVPANVRFRADAQYSQLWKPYITAPNSEACTSAADVTLPDEDFPVTWKA